MVIILQQKLAPYRIPFYTELVKKKKFVVLFSEFENMDESDLAGSPKVFLKIPSIRINFFKWSFFWLSTFTFLRRYKPEAVVFELSNYNLNLLYHLIFKPFYSFKVIGWGHGYFRKDKKGKRLIPRCMKKIIASGCDSIITYTLGGQKYLENIGINRTKIHVAWNTIHVNHLENIKPIGVKFELKRLVFIGRLIPEKKPELACEILLSLNNLKDEFFLEMIGDGPLMSVLKCKYGHVTNINFHGSIIDNIQLEKILNASSAILNPGYLGLNIVHAVAYELPIISPIDSVGSVYHSPEYEYIQNENCLIRVEALDVEVFCCQIRCLFESYSLYSRSVESAKEIGRAASIERMVSGYVQAFS